jgi:hypothetical protein
VKQVQFDRENQQISQLLKVFLKSKANESSSANNTHLDEDSISAFVDGSLSQRESEPVIKHLVGCVSCRNVSARLVQLTEELNEQPEVTSPIAEPNRLQQFLQSLGLSGFNISDEAVFAHNDSSEDNNTEDGENQETETNGSQKSNK